MDGSRVVTTGRKFLKELFAAWGEGRSPQAAAALAYYGMFSFAPLLYIMLTVAGLFLDELMAAEELFGRLQNIFGPEVTQFILDVMGTVSETATGGSLLTSVIAFVALLFAASGMFSQLQYALNTIWGVPPPAQRGLIAIVLNRLLAFVAVIGLGLLLVLVTVFGVILSMFGTALGLDSSFQIVDTIAIVALATVAFALIYKVLPDVDIGWRDVWVGALLTAVLFGVARWLLALYLSVADVGSAFGAAGALAVILIAIYYLALIFLFGAVFTKVYASMFGTQAGPPAEPKADATHAAPMEETL
jgi:membrane protein